VTSDATHVLAVIAATDTEVRAGVPAAAGLAEGRLHMALTELCELEAIEYVGGWRLCEEQPAAPDDGVQPAQPALLEIGGAS